MDSDDFAHQDQLTCYEEMGNAAQPASAVGGQSEEITLH